jgi:hypothetical protein
VHNAIVGQSMNITRAAGSVSHEAFFRLSPPGTPESLEFLAVDTWYDAEGMGRVYDDPAFMSSLMKMFAAEPMTGVWVHPAGSWVEW